MSIGRVLTACGLLLIGSAALFPTPRAAAAAADTPLWCLVCGRTGGVDVLLNVALFVPLGLGLRLSGLSPRHILALSALLSLTIESLQFTLIPGRDASLSDVLTNTTGGGLGAWVAPRLPRLLRPDPVTAGRLAASGAAIWLGILAVSAHLLRPWAPAGPLRSDWSYDLYRGPFKGKVIAAELAGVPVHQGWLRDSVELRRRIRYGLLGLRIDLVSGPPTDHWAPILSVRGEEPLLVVHQDHRDLIVELPSRAQRWRLRTPALRLIDALPREPGKPVTVRGEETRRNVTISTWYRGANRARSLALSPSFGWCLVFPFEYAFGESWRVLTGMWLAALLLPLGYWTVRSRGTWPFVGLGLVLGVGLGIVPALTGYPPPHWSEWLGAAAGAAAGCGLAALGAYLACRCASPSTSESCSS